MTSRRVTIQTPLGDTLQFHRLVGTEALSSPYLFEVDLFAATNAIAPKALLGKHATVAIRTQSRDVRHLGGIVTEFGLSHEDNRHSFYKMSPRPWVWLATRRSDYRIFQDLTAPEVIAAVLAPYGYAMEQKLNREYRRWAYCCQYGETDFAFVSRLAEHEGIYYWIRHEAGQHVLVFGDDIAASNSPLPGGETIRYHVDPFAGMTGGPEAERIYEWAMAQALRSGAYYADDYDLGKPRADLSSRQRMPAGHDHDRFEQYEWPGGYTQWTDGETYAQIRTEEQLSEHVQAHGASNRRDLAPGHTFELTRHPRVDQNQRYLLVAVAYELQENLQASEGNGGDGSVQRFAFRAQPLSHAWRPTRTTSKPRTDGPQAALVVGRAGEEHWMDSFGRIKVQFHWDRIGRRDEHSSCWVRVSTAWAGASFGAVSLPRIGMEVVVDFLNGDPDHPIITGCIHNADNMPAWALPGQSHLSGIRSRELGGGGRRSDHLVLDDGPKKIQAQLKSDHASSSLALGHTGCIEDKAGRTDDRGQGFELRTDAHGALRAAKGLLLTTEGRPDARGHATDMPETIARLTQGRDMHDGLSQMAMQTQAHEAGDQDTVTQTLKAQNDALAGRGGNPAESIFPEFEEPHLTLASAAGIQTTAQGSTHIASAEHTAITSGAHASLACGDSFLVSAKDAVRMIACNNGIRMAAAAADIDITALKNSINVLAKLDIKLEAGRITITAKEELRINGGGSFTCLNASGIVSGTGGISRVHAATHSFVGPKSLPVPSTEARLPNLDLGPYKADYLLYKTDNRPFEHYAYEIHDRHRRQQESGDTSNAGRTRIINSEVPIGLQSYKSVMRRSELITENWEAKLEAKARAAEARRDGGTA
jgi:type VI secretion system secreted protein VgrG